RDQLGQDGQEVADERGGDAQLPLDVLLPGIALVERVEQLELLLPQARQLPRAPEEVAGRHQPEGELLVSVFGRVLSRHGWLRLGWPRTQLHLPEGAEQ